MKKTLNITSEFNFAKACQRRVDAAFSNSLIIHQKITAVTVVWTPVFISIDFDDFTSPFYSLV